MILRCWALCSSFLCYSFSFLETQEPKGRSLSRMKGPVRLVFCLWQQVTRTDNKKDKELIIVCPRPATCRSWASWARHVSSSATSCKKSLRCQTVPISIKRGEKNIGLQSYLPISVRQEGYTSAIHLIFLLISWQKIYVLGARFPPRDSDTDILMWTSECKK